jgi:hypothetical protein
MKTRPWRSWMSFGVRSTMRLIGWANSRSRQPATRSLRSSDSSPSRRPSSPRRWRGSSGSTCCWAANGGAVSGPMILRRRAQRMNVRIRVRWVDPSASQKSRCSWWSSWRVRVCCESHRRRSAATWIWVQA